MINIPIGEYVEIGIDWIAYKFEPFSDGVTIGIDVVVTAFQGVLLYLHPFIMMGLMAVFAYWVISRKYGSLSLMGWRTGRGMLLFTVVGLFLLYGMGFWQETMETLALVITSAIIALLLGVPMGIYASRSDRFEQMLRPVLDFMQTMPAFVYLIPAILFFQVGNVPGVVATVVFALPPGVRLTNLGIREVPKDVVEASHAFGCTDKQLLYKVQIPLAMPTIMAGINQVIMLSLSMVVIASMVGAAGLGQKVYMGILKAKIGLGFEAGLGIVIIAILLDRITQSFGQTEHRNAGSE